MQCKSCKADVSSKMKAALQKNECPFCGQEIMESKRAKQYAALVGTLESTKLTNKDELDQKIKEKVIQLLVDNFTFTQISSPKEEDDVVVVDEIDEVEKVDEVKETEEDAMDDVPTRTLTQAKSRSAKIRPPAPTSGNPSARMYQEAAESHYDAGDDMDPVADRDDPEDAKYFQDSVSPEVRQKVEERVAKARAAQANISSSGGIRKLR